MLSLFHTERKISVCRSLDYIAILLKNFMFIASRSVFIEKKWMQMIIRLNDNFSQRVERTFTPARGGARAEVSEEAGTS